MQKGSEVQRSNFQNGHYVSGAVYTNNWKHWDFIADCMRLHLESNPLHFAEFGYVGQMEAEIFKMALDLYKGDKDSCGLMTSGGTESIFTAMLAYRQQSRSRGITHPNVVASQTAHAAFDKACFYLNMEIRKVPVKADLSCDVEAMKK